MESHSSHAVSTTGQQMSRDRVPKFMQAMSYRDYGDADVLALRTSPVPARKFGQLLIKVAASSVNPIDYRLRRGEMKGLLPGGFPRIPGYDVSGVVADCDPGCEFRIGDRVMAFLDHVRGGAAAEYATCANEAAARLPDELPFDEAAAIPLAGTTALQSLRDHGNLQPGQRVLINGASGGVGCFAVQIAKAYGCHVDAVASAANRDFCLELGADRFFDYRSTDFTKLGEQWDLIFDASAKSGYLQVRHALFEGGRYVSTEPDVKGIVMTLLTGLLSKAGKAMLARPSGDDLRELIRLYQQNKLRVIIDSRFPLVELAQAHRRVEDGVDRGKVVVIHDQKTSDL